MVSKEMSKEIHSKAAPFIQWLKEAEEESSEEEDNEGEDSAEELEVAVCCCHNNFNLVLMQESFVSTDEELDL